MASSGYRSAFFALASLPAAESVAAQESPVAPVPEIASSQGDRQVYLPADFARFAPKDALDMLEQVPGFTIVAEVRERGLGEASGNVLLNGQRLSSKSDSIIDRLRRIPAQNVIRIEIVDGATLDVPGLSGRVANIVANASSAVQGQFDWNPQLPAAYSTMRWFQGTASLSGNLGGIDVTLSIANSPFHGGTGGPNIVTFGSGRVEERFSHTRSEVHNPKLTAGLRRTWASGVSAGLNAAYQWDRGYSREDEFVIPIADEPAAFERIRGRTRGHNYELGGDVEFGLGPGRLKLIALESYRHTNARTQSVIDPDTDAPDFGSRFILDSEAGERIGRAEYNWPMWGGDWQLSGEAAFNRLDQVAGLFFLQPGGAFEQAPFPAGTGGVREDRYETIVSFGRPLTRTLSLQLTGGGEYSTIGQTGPNALSRTFVRPKGSLSLAWTPDPALAVSLRIARKVGQLEFADFLAEVNLANDNSNDANNELRPEQSWETELEAARDFGAWGSLTAKLFDYRVTDFIAIVPVPGGGAAVGNIDSARTYGLTFDGTLRLDPLGFPGARLEVAGQFRKSRLIDPVTGDVRAYDLSQPRNIEFDFRHDVPRTAWAWGASFRNTTFNPYYRVAEFGYEYNNPYDVGVFVEHKDVFGLTVQARMNNILKGDSVLERTVYAGPRSSAAVLFSENRRREIGRVINFTVKGSF